MCISVSMGVVRKMEEQMHVLVCLWKSFFLLLLLRYSNEHNEHEDTDGPKHQCQGEREGRL